MESDRRRGAVELASSHLLTACATFAAIAPFVGIGSEILPGSLGLAPTTLADHAGLVTAFILNIAVIIFGWRRSRDLSSALAANAEAEQRAHESAYSDHVTGLANRRMLVRRLDELLLLTGRVAILILLDIDHFKKVNDLFGHGVGVRRRAFVGETLRAQVPADACCARLGGDEFAILIPGPTGREAIESIAEAIVTRLREPVRLESVVAHISASVGISEVDAATDTPEPALRRS